MNIRATNQATGLVPTDTVASVNGGQIVSIWSQNTALNKHTAVITANMVLRGVVSAFTVSRPKPTSRVAKNRTIVRSSPAGTAVSPARQSGVYSCDRDRFRISIWGNYLPQSLQDV